MWDALRESTSAWITFCLLLITGIMIPIWRGYTKRAAEKAAEELVDESRRIKTHMDEALNVERIKITSAMIETFDRRDKDLRHFIADAVDTSTETVREKLATNIIDQLGVMGKLQQVDVEHAAVLGSLEKRMDKIEKVFLPGLIDLKNRFGLNQRKTDAVRIVCIDDDESFRKLVELLLIEAEIVATFEGVSSIAEAIKIRCDLYLLDLGLHESDGLDTLRKLREQIRGHDEYGAPQDHINTPIVVLTSSDEMGPDAVRIGATEFVPKNNIHLRGELERVISIALLRPQKHIPRD